MGTKLYNIFMDMYTQGLEIAKDVFRCFEQYLNNEISLEDALKMIGKKNFHTGLEEPDNMKYFDLVMPSIAIAQGFGRVGCMFAGCCYGRETDSWFHVIYETSQFAPNGVALIPTQMIMALLNFAHFFLLVILAKKVVKADGQVAGFYLVFYSIGRFFLEYLRNDPRGEVKIFSTSQFISLFILLAGVGTILLCGYLKKKQTVIVDKTEATTEEAKTEHTEQ